MKRNQLRMSSFNTLIQHAIEVLASAISRGKEMNKTIRNKSLSIHI